jgi:hypothetical protein
MIDHELYLPLCWTDDPDRLRAGHRPRPARAHRGRTGPRRHPHRRAAEAGMAAAVGRARSTPTALSEDPGCWWLLVRRNRTSGEPAFYRC